MKNTLFLLGLAMIIILGGCKKPGIVSCEIISPRNGAELPINRNITVMVDASDSKGTIAMVTVFFDNNPGISTTTDPFRVIIPSALLTLGKHTIKAVAVNNEGTQEESTITVNIISDESPDFVTFADGKIPPGWKTSTWEVDMTIGYDDNYSLKSKNHPASVVAGKTMNASSYVEFFTRGDNFDLYIDNEKAQAFSSVPADKENWTKWIYILDGGKHEFSWETTSDPSIYLDAISFAVSTLPEVTTNSTVTNITTTSATSGGKISDDVNSPVISRGVCWSTSQNPTINNSKTVDGSGTGSFTSNITGLTTNTLYYVRAYATNRVGTAYGEQVTFTTQSADLPTITTSNITNITSSSATGGGNVTNSGSGSVTARGVCWSTSQNPTINNSKTVDGSGTGSFTSNITGCSPNTTYYVRAYATNSVGTAYGNQVSFTTTSSSNTAKVRFQKKKAYDYVSEMSVDNASGGELASYYFGTAAGTSPYYDIPPGQHVPWYYYTYPGNSGWYHCLDNSTYNFQIGRKYSVVCDDDGSYLIFYVTDDGPGKSSEPGEQEKIVSPITKIPKKQASELTEKPRADVSN